MSGTPSATPGTAVTAGASNVDGATVSLIAAITHDIEYLVISSSTFFTSAANTSTLLDIMIDRAGGTTWETNPVIPDLLSGMLSPYTNKAGCPLMYHFPIWLPSGCSLGARARTAKATTQVGYVAVMAYGGNSNPGSWWCGTNVEAIGITAASSRGTLHTPGVSAAFSAWANLGSPTTQHAKALQFAGQGSGSTSMVASSYMFEFGVGDLLVGHSLYKITSTLESGFTYSNGPTFCDVPANSQLRARGSGSAATVTAIDLAVYAVS